MCVCKAGVYVHVCECVNECVTSSNETISIGAVSAGTFLKKVNWGWKASL